MKWVNGSDKEQKGGNLKGSCFPQNTHLSLCRNKKALSAVVVVVV